MTPLIFILVATVVLSVLILWVLRSVVNNRGAWPPQQDFGFESAAELALPEGEYYLARDSIRLQSLDKGWARVSWNLSWAKLEQACAEYHLKPDPKYIVLRLQADNGQYHELDLWVKSLAGQYRFQPDQHTSYCAILGISQYQQFHPILTSVTVSSLAGKQ